MQPEGLHHIAVICSDLTESNYFYIHTLGGEEISTHFRIETNSWKVDLKLWNVHIELFWFPNSPKRLSNPEASGWRHIAFRTEDVSKTRDWLIEKEIETEEIRIDPYTNKEFFFFRDPSGNPIEIYSI